MPSYVPPHMRPGYKPSQPAAAVTKRRGVHFQSNKTGLRSTDEQWHRFAGVMANLPPPTRAETAAAVSRSLSRRTVKAKPTLRKSALKTRGRTVRQTRSATPKRSKAHTVRAKSK